MLGRVITLVLVALAVSATASAQAKPEIEIDPIEAEYVAVKNANVRKLPTADSDQVALLEAGTRVQVAGKVKDRNWYLVERDDKPLGYVYGELLKDMETVLREERDAQRNAERVRREEEDHM
jgi:uncharacterized protein YgiM (DUF1202 family)